MESGRVEQWSNPPVCSGNGSQYGKVLMKKAGIRVWFAQTYWMEDSVRSPQNYNHLDPGRRNLLYHPVILSWLLGVGLRLYRVRGVADLERSGFLTKPLNCFTELIVTGWGNPFKCCEVPEGTSVACYGDLFTDGKDKILASGTSVGKQGDGRGGAFAVDTSGKPWADGQLP
ncbi:hypothetical protein FGB62_393g03 [Gracilaria domingensis]|nr:hypothetical protein FGB62_393g03 [Gracilaria domingensis]